MIGPIPPGMDDPWDNEFGGNNMQAWRERERRQRTVRLLMMFLLMLLLMDGEEQSARRRSEHSRLRRNQLKRPPVLEEDLFEGRSNQDTRLLQAIATHGRGVELKKLNGGRDVDAEIRAWAESEERKQQSETTGDKKVPENPEDRKKVYHYPWNATGFYRGEWTRKGTLDDETSRQALEDDTQDDSDETDESGFPLERKSPVQYKTPLEMEGPMQEILNSHDERVGVFLLPSGVKLKSGPNFNATKLELEEQASSAAMYEARMSVKRPASPLLSNLRVRQPELNKIVPEEDEEEQSLLLRKLTLTKSSGRAAFQFYSRSVPAMKEISLLDGFVKLYDSSTVGYSTRRDILLRVRGVVIHSIGRISMVANVASGRSALVIPEKKGQLNDLDGEKRRRRLFEALANLSNEEDQSDNIHALEEQIRDDALVLYPFESLEETANDWTLNSVDLDEDAFRENEKRHIFGGLLNGRKLSAVEELDETPSATGTSELAETKDDTENSTTPHLDVVLPVETHEETVDSVSMAPRRTESHGISKTEEIAKPKAKTEEPPPRSNVVLPYPYVLDDKKESIRKAKTPATRRMPQREVLLEANAGRCEFELNFDIQPIQWTVGEWKALVGRRVHETAQVDPSFETKDGAVDDESDDEQEPLKRRPITNRKRSLPESSRGRNRVKSKHEPALAMEIVGLIDSPNCDFTATLNATAIRTDWEHTTGKAINYSFYMMLTCLTQIVVLLRQLLHTQAQSAATRVSLLCVGWQTVLDALLCLGHISLSLGMQPLFTAFASVAFFKLLIFCVIEMKYMAIIMQARNNSNGGQNTAELLRRQVTMLHLRFYAALMAVVTGFVYAGEQYRTACVLALYSFWVPQIILNIVTEAKRPLHSYYIYGMSISRLVAPLYIFAVPNNFLKEVYPDAPSYPFMCQLLVLWIGVQTAVLIAQGRYGARFMIPARFLPPKFDYSRPIPDSLLPPGAVPSSPESSFTEGMVAEVEVQTLRECDNTTSNRHSSTTRNRIKGNRGRSSSRVTETTTETPLNGNGNSDTMLDCVICYNGIDVHNHRGYMLAPCDHIFHRDCLVQWMDVKMECPICRTELPSL